jgi:hypothetical protein
MLVDNTSSAAGVSECFMTAYAVSREFYMRVLTTATPLCAEHTGRSERRLGTPQAHRCELCIFLVPSYSVQN